MASVQLANHAGLVVPFMEDDLAEYLDAVELAPCLDAVNRVYEALGLVTEYFIEETGRGFAIVGQNGLDHPKVVGKSLLPEGASKNFWRLYVLNRAEFAQLSADELWRIYRHWRKPDDPDGSNDEDGWWS